MRITAKSLLFALWVICGHGLVAEARQFPEVYYRDHALSLWGGTAEVSLPNGTRCDILTDEYAIEVDFADKWAEAIGQSLNYAAQTGRKAAIILVIEKPSQDRFLQRLEQTIESFQLPILIIALRNDKNADERAPIRTLSKSAVKRFELDLAINEN